MTRLAEELESRFQQLGHELSGAAVTLDRSTSENELVMRVRPTTPSVNKAELDVAVGAEDTVVLSVGRFGLVELVASDPVALATEVEEFAKAVLEGRIKERLITVAGRPASSELRVAFHDGVRSYHHTRFRIGRREELVLDYGPY